MADLSFRDRLPDYRNQYSRLKSKDAKSASSTVSRQRTTIKGQTLGNQSNFAASGPQAVRKRRKNGNRKKRGFMRPVYHSGGDFKTHPIAVVGQTLGYPVQWEWSRLLHHNLEECAGCGGGLNLQRRDAILVLDDVQHG